MAEDLAGTKEVIFDAALELFADRGYESVSMREISEKSGLNTVASLYYYFKSKRLILDCIYQFLADHFFDNVMSADEVIKVYDDGTYLDFLNAASWTFYGSSLKESKRMTLILKITYMRIMLHDEKATNIFKDLVINGNWERAKKILEYGVSIGKLAPEINLRAFFETLLYTRLFTGIIGLENYTEGKLEPKLYLNEFLAQLLEGYHKNKDIK